MEPSKKLEIKSKINKIDEQIELLSKDRSFIKTIISSISFELEEFIERISINYNLLIKKIAFTEDESISKEIDDLLERIIDKRLTIMKEVADKSLNRIERIINNPFWLGERNPYLEIIKRIRNQIIELETQQKLKAVSILSSILDEIKSIDNRLDNDTKRAQIRLPIQIFMWGLPIIVGIWISGKLTSIQNIISLVVLIIITLTSYFIFRYRLFSRFQLFKNIIKTFKNKRISSMILMQVIALIFVSTFGFIEPINDYIIKSRFKINYSLVQNIAKPGEQIKISYKIQYNHELAAVGVKIQISAPGISDGVQENNYRALSISKPEESQFLIDVPNDIPYGQYSLELTVSFSAQRAISFFVIPKLNEYDIHKYIEISINK